MRLLSCKKASASRWIHTPHQGFVSPPPRSQADPYLRGVVCTGDPDFDQREHREAPRASLQLNLCPVPVPVPVGLKSSSTTNCCGTGVTH